VFLDLNEPFDAFTDRAVKLLLEIVTPVFAVALFEVPFAVKTAPDVVGEIELNPGPWGPVAPVDPVDPCGPVGPVAPATP
jgi:hypothetical protein